MKVQTKAAILVAAALACTSLLMGALWQLEIIYIDMGIQRPYCYPFMLGCSYNYCQWRDFWYCMIFIAYLVPWILLLWLFRRNT